MVNHGQHRFGKVQEPEDPSVGANPRGQSILRGEGWYAILYAGGALVYVLIMVNDCNIPE